MNLVTRGISFLGGVMLVASATLAAPLAHAPNEKSGTISVIDMGKDDAVAEIRRAPERQP